MNGNEDIDEIAAEYALGTLPADERRAAETRRMSDRALDAAIADWEGRLAPLADGIPPVEPPAWLFAAIEARLGLARASSASTPAVASNVTVLEEQVRRWRTLATAAYAMAAALLLVAGLRETTRPPATPQNFVAVLQKDAASPAFLMSVDLATRQLTVRTVAAPAQPGKSYELWIVHDKLGAPRSLGTVGDQRFASKATLAAYDPGLVGESTFAVTLEPAGGSATGAPTGSVLFAGKLVQATPARD